MKVGTTVKLNRPVLGNESGTYGVCFNDYGTGGQIIFPNGNYDGFSTEEQEQFLVKIGFDYSVAKYLFTNVIQLSYDFEAGTFDSVFKPKKLV